MNARLARILSKVVICVLVKTLVSDVLQLSHWLMVNVNAHKISSKSMEYVKLVQVYLLVANNVSVPNSALNVVTNYGIS